MPVKQASGRIHVNFGVGREAVAAAAQLACVLEVAAEKPGNITPSHDFADTSYEDMLASAIALGSEMGRAGERGVGETVLAAVRATRAVAGANTNLGIALLLAPLARAATTHEPLAAAPGQAALREPLAAAPGQAALREPLAAAPGPAALREPLAAAPGPAASPGRDGAALRGRLRAVLDALTVEDARAAYEAIRLAGAGGLEEPVEHDVRDEPAITLREAMAAAAGRDAIAAEYASGFEVTFGLGLPALSAALEAGLRPRAAIVELALRLLVAAPDTLIARKRGLAAAERVSTGAARVLGAGGARASDALAAFDASLRTDGNALNPGTTADLVTAVLFVHLLTADAREGVR